MKKFNKVMVLSACFFIGFMLFSIFFLFSSLQYGDLILEYLFNREIILALWISISSSTLVVLITLLFGIPTAWLLAYKEFNYKSFLETLIVDIPHSFPPGVVGTTYLLMFHPSNLMGRLFETLGFNLINTFWAMILVKTFISSPFLVGILTIKFREIRNSGLEIIAQSLGASQVKSFKTVALPLSFKIIVAGSVRCWARALGEVAGTIVFAGAIIPGVTQTMPALIVFEAQESIEKAMTLALILAAFSILTFLTIKILMERREE
ncbi:MAG: ABC transporter permease subunit [Promethearchaeia archaeon]